MYNEAEEKSGNCFFFYIKSKKEVELMDTIGSIRRATQGFRVWIPRERNGFMHCKNEISLNSSIK